MGISQSEFSRLLGVPRSTVHGWEAARNKPDDDSMLKVAKILNTSISYLWGETDHPGPAPDWHKDVSISSEAEAQAMALLRQATSLLALEGTPTANERRRALREAVERQGYEIVEDPPMVSQQDAQTGQQKPAE